MKKLFYPLIAASIFTAGYFSRPYVDEAITAYQFFNSIAVSKSNEILEERLDENIHSETRVKNRKGMEIPIENVEIYQKNGEYLIRGKFKGKIYEIGLQKDEGREKSFILYFFKE